MDWTQLRRAVHRATPDAENLLAFGLEGEPSGRVETLLQRNQQYQKARKIINAHLEKHSRVDDQAAADVDDQLVSLEIHVAQAGFALGVAYGLLLNRDAFLHGANRSESRHAARHTERRK